MVEGALRRFVHIALLRPIVIGGQPACHGMRKHPC
jgi:hypothetical protein